MRVNVILAHCREYGIGYAGKMAWRNGTDLQLFSKLTTGRGDYKNAIVMGRKTWQSLPGKRPLASRDNLILSRLSSEDGGDKSCDHSHSHIAWFSDIDAVLNHCANKQYDEVWIIGGQQLYSTFLGAQAPYRSLVHTVHITRIDADFKCDAFCSADAVSETALQEYFVPSSRRTEVAEKCVNLSADSDTHPSLMNVDVTFCKYVKKCDCATNPAN
jgi:dihydrofolate reductase